MHPYIVNLYDNGSLEEDCAILRKVLAYHVSQKSTYINSLSVSVLNLTSNKPKPKYFDFTTMQKVLNDLPNDRPNRHKNR